MFPLGAAQGHAVSRNDDEGAESLIGRPRAGEHYGPEEGALRARILEAPDSTIGPMTCSGLPRRV